MKRLKWSHRVQSGNQKLRHPFVKECDNHKNPNSIIQTVQFHHQDLDFDNANMYENEDKHGSIADIDFDRDLVQTKQSRIYETGTLFKNHFPLFALLTYDDIHNFDCTII